MKNVLIVDDNQTLCLMLKSWLLKKGYVADFATTVEEAKTKVRNNLFDLVLSDIRLPDSDGIDFLSWCKRYDPNIVVIMMTSFADVETAVASIQKGASDYISKPIEPDLLFEKMDTAFKKKANQAEFRSSGSSLLKAPGKEFGAYYEQLEKIAQNSYHTFISGAQGSGKSVAINYIYEKSIYNNGNFVTVNLIDKNKKNINYFNGAFINKYIEEARGGILLILAFENLDTLSQNEVLNLVMKQKQDASYVQIIGCTEKKIKDFKTHIIPKLYNLLLPNSVVIPELAGKSEDILFYAHNYLTFANEQLDKNVKGFSPEFEKSLINHTWKRNIQELKNTIIKAVLSTKDGMNISKECAEEFFSAEPKVVFDKVDEPNSTGDFSLKDSLKKENFEKENIINALNMTKWNKTLAASLLNIDRKTLYNKLKQYQIESPN